MEATPGFEPGNQGFADPCLTTWLCRHIRNQEQKDLAPDSLLWSGRRGSNPLPPPWQGGALPDELRPHKCAAFNGISCTALRAIQLHMIGASGRN